MYNAPAVSDVRAHIGTAQIFVHTYLFLAGADFTMLYVKCHYSDGVKFKLKQSAE